MANSSSSSSFPPSRSPVPRVLSGMRPTGKLHLGNYMGALKNWVDLQNELGSAGNFAYKCYFFIADWHALTTDYANPSRIKQNTLDVALDFRAAGLDPEQSTIFVQSHVPQHAELHLLLSMITPLSWLERVPTYKDQQDQLKEKDLATYGFLGYPLLQAADILIYQPDFVPVGQDQIAHVEITREIARRFNQFYPAELSVLPEPKVLLTPSPKLPGTDGRKMSKSYGNTIMLSDPLKLVEKKLEKMTNGGQRYHVSDPGDPDICPVADLHHVFSSREVDTEIRSKCRNAQFSCLDCKHLLYKSLEPKLTEIQDKRADLEKDLDNTWNLLIKGAEEAADRAEKTMKLVRAAIGVSRDTSGLRRPSVQIENLKYHRLIAHGMHGRTEIWHLSDEERNLVLAKEWLETQMSSSTTLSRAEGSVYLAPRNRRVLILSSVARTADTWTFQIKRKSYELLVLLCAEPTTVVPDGFEVLDFVIPQKVYRAQWSQIDRAAKEVRVEIRRTSEGYFLYIASAEPIKINVDLRNYEALR